MLQHAVCCCATYTTQCCRVALLQAAGDLASSPAAAQLRPPSQAAGNGSSKADFYQSRVLNTIITSHYIVHDDPLVPFESCAREYRTHLSMFATRAHLADVNCIAAGNVSVPSASHAAHTAGSPKHRGRQRTAGERSRRRMPSDQTMREGQTLNCMRRVSNCSADSAASSGVQLLGGTGATAPDEAHESASRLRCQGQQQVAPQLSLQQVSLSSAPGNSNCEQTSQPGDLSSTKAGKSTSSPSLQADMQKAPPAVLAPIATHHQRSYSSGNVSAKQTGDMSAGPTGGTPRSRLMIGQPSCQQDPEYDAIKDTLNAYKDRCKAQELLCRPQ